MSKDLKYKSKADVYKSRAWQLYNKKQYSKAIKEYEECLRWFKKAAKWRGIYNKHVGDILGQLGQCYKLMGRSLKDENKIEGAKRNLEEALKCFQEAKKYYYDATRDPDARNVSQLERDMGLNIKKCENLIQTIEHGGTDGFREYVSTEAAGRAPEVPGRTRQVPERIPGAQESVEFGPVFHPVEEQIPEEREPVFEMVCEAPSSLSQVEDPPLAKMEEPGERPEEHPSGDEGRGFHHLPNGDVDRAPEETTEKDDTDGVDAISSRLSELVDKINKMEKISGLGERTSFKLEVDSQEYEEQEEEEEGREGEKEEKEMGGKIAEEMRKDEEDGEVSYNLEKRTSPAPRKPQISTMNSTHAIGMQYYRFKKYQDALNYFEKALKNNPSDGEAQRMAEECRSHLRGR